ncbi:hypothetical protein [Sphingomonas paucimobilis]|uniref:hypothetical protein n=1 Tax=Sphingomonas paucimobilis TaxID=13689 RepID=UPI0030FBF445
MNDATPRSLWKELVSIFGILLTIVTLLVGGGRLLGAIDENTRRIVVLEQRADRRDESFADLRERIGAMDAKLDLLVKRSTGER